MLLLIDNYDSFAYNLYQLVGSLYSDIKVIRNDELSVEEIAALAPEYIIISPGPGKPFDAGVCVELVQKLKGKVPILGVCLGHQAICEAFGGVVSYAKELMHGKSSVINFDADTVLFKGISGNSLKNTLKVARYHSLAAVENTLPNDLKVTAKAENGEVMAVEHSQYPIYGLQFHPESILTDCGGRIIANFLEKKIIANVTEAETATDTETSGMCGENLTWTLDTDTGVLEINGTGKMNEWSTSPVMSFDDFAPWVDSKTIASCIKKVIIGNGVTSIGNHAFHWCENLTEITIPDSVTDIGWRAFFGCTGLTSITIPDSVTSIGNGAFMSCTSLTSITIPNSVTSIEQGAFRGCTNLNEITIPDSVTSIGSSAFMSCTSLTSITIPNSVTYIDTYAFWDCTSLTEIIIPDSVTSIGNSAFYDCTSLTSITIGNGLTLIGKCAFDGCTNLIEVTIGNHVEVIPDFAFFGCTSLTAVTIPKGVTSIKKYALGYYSDGRKFNKVDNFTIYGTKGTAAEKYAVEEGFKFREIGEKP